VLGTDFNRQLWYEKTTVEQDVDYILMHWQLLEQIKGTTNIVHSVIPKFASPIGEIMFDSKVPGAFIKVKQIDQARDGLHYDRLTAQNFVQQIQCLLQ
jgi:hypothetical protein